MFNVENFVVSWSRSDTLTSILNNEGGDDYLNPVRTSDGVSCNFSSKDDR